MRGIGSVFALLLPALATAAGAIDRPVPVAPPASGAQAVAPGGQGADAAVGVVAGAYAYKSYCASCHGADGKGEGPMAESLRFRPADLTLIARKNGGTFPADRVHRIVDGRNPLKGHGGPDMPIWGDAFKNAETGYDDVQVKAKVQLVVDYLKTIQAR